MVSDAVYTEVPKSVAFLFPGLGEQYFGMGREIYNVEPEYQKWIDYCSAYLARDLGFDIREVLLAEPESTQVYPRGVNLRRLLARERSSGGFVQSRLSQTNVAQPAVFVLEYALAQLFTFWGFRPCALLGHSLGEYVAACVSGVLKLEDALHVVVRRAELMQTLPSGSMLAVASGVKDLHRYLTDDVYVAAINAETSTVLSGPSHSIEQIRVELTNARVASRILDTTHAFHSAMMEPVAGQLRKLIAGIPLNRPLIPYLSNVTGNWIRIEEARDPEYWVQHMCGTVKFGQGLEVLLSDGQFVLLELGPGRSLASFAKLSPNGWFTQTPRSISAMKYGWEPTAELVALGVALGGLWQAGVEIGGEAFPDISAMNRSRVHVVSL